MWELLLWISQQRSLTLGYIYSDSTVSAFSYYELKCTNYACSAHNITNFIWQHTVYSTHRGCHINTVLPVTQDGEYIAPRVGYTHDSFAAVRQLLDVGSSISCCSCCLQHKGSKVEKQSYEMVKHVLRKRRENALERNAERFSRFKCKQQQT